MSDRLKIVFMGSSDFAVKSLEALVEMGNIELVSIFTQPDRKVGRKRELKFTPVKEKALEIGLPVFQPEKSSDIYPLLKDKETDFIVVVAYGLIIKQDVIDLPKFEILNVHGSLLPKYRGASPIHAALANGDKKAGVCVMKVVKALDAGSVYKCAEIDITKEDDFAILHDKLALLGAGLLPQVVLGISKGKIEAVEQDEEQVSVCRKIKQEDSLIDFENMKAEHILNLFKAYKYWPKLWFVFKDKKIKLLKFKFIDDLNLNAGEFLTRDEFLYVGTLSKTLQLIEIQAESRKAMNVSDFLRGNPDYFEKD